MTNKDKSFDSVKMKRRASLRIYEETKDMSLEERQKYWSEKEKEFLRRQHLRKSKKSDVLK